MSALKRGDAVSHVAVAKEALPEIEIRLPAASSEAGQKLIKGRPNSIQYPAGKTSAEIAKSLISTFKIEGNRIPIVVNPEDHPVEAFSLMNLYHGSRQPLEQSYEQSSIVRTTLAASDLFHEHSYSWAQQLRSPENTGRYEEIPINSSGKSKLKQHGLDFDKAGRYGTGPEYNGRHGESGDNHGHLSPKIEEKTDEIYYAALYGGSGPNSIDLNQHSVTFTGHGLAASQELREELRDFGKEGPALKDFNKMAGVVAHALDERKISGALFAGNSMGGQAASNMPSAIAEIALSQGKPVPALASVTIDGEGTSEAQRYGLFADPKNAAGIIPNVNWAPVLANNSETGNLHSRIEEVNRSVEAKNPTMLSEHSEPMRKYFGIEKFSEVKVVSSPGTLHMIMDLDDKSKVFARKNGVQEEVSADVCKLATSLFGVHGLSPHYGPILSTVEGLVGITR